MFVLTGNIGSGYHAKADHRHAVVHFQRLFGGSLGRKRSEERGKDMVTRVQVSTAKGPRRGGTESSPVDVPTFMLN